MLKKTKKGHYILERFTQQKGLMHGFSTRKLADIDRFLSVFNLAKRNLVLMEQVHGNEIKVVGEKDKGKVLPGIDGMVSVEKGTILGVKTADCLPILFYDMKRKIIGVAHAGWQGVLKKITQKTVKKMRSLGCQPKNILVGIGPHIGPCCYTVSKERVDGFVKEFGNLKGMIGENCEGIHLDLVVPTIVQLIKVGILRKNIDFGLDCTSCQNDEFFSYRKEKGKNGALLGIIGVL